MSDSIPNPWISQYIIQVAEKFGKSFTEIPIDVITPTKMKRVQIIEVSVSIHFVFSGLTVAVSNIQ